MDRRTGQYMIHVGDGIQYARTVMRLPEPNKWEKDRLAEIKATPWSLHVPKDPEVIFGIRRTQNRRLQLISL